MDDLSKLYQATHDLERYLERDGLELDWSWFY